jgi:hypothetical protein
MKKGKARTGTPVTFAYHRAAKEDQSNAITAKAISPVPTQPRTVSQGFALNRPIRRELATMTIISSAA